ncbi:MFS transporter [Microbacterium oleivorans]|uniref:MFS transporter n=1 Tax=Microbacterium oleivorans TaxID=273677 RepID=UPI0009F55BFA|nr:MFS transporter [Microbacterium oleivorans]
MYISLTNSPPDAAETRAPRGIRTVSSTVVTLGLVSLLTDISSESVSAVLPLYVTGMLGLSTIAFGLLDGLYQGVSALVRIAGGYTSDRLGRPKWVAFSGYAVAAAARVGLLFASSFAALSVVLTADRIGKGIRTAPRDALIAASSDPQNRGAAFGVHRMLDNIGAAIGPLLAFVILWLIPDGYDVVFAVSLSCAVIGLLILGILVPNVRTRPEAPERAARRRDRRDAWTTLRRGPFRRVLAAAGILGIVTIGDGFVYLALQGRNDFAAQWFPLLYVGTNVAFLALAVPLGRLADRVGRARVFVAGHVGLLAAYVVAALAIDDLVATLLCLAFLGAFYAATDGVLAALAADLTTPETRATGIAAAQTVVAVSRFGSAALFGVLWFAVGRETALVIAALVLAGAVVGAAIALRPVIRKAAS